MKKTVVMILAQLFCIQLMAQTTIHGKLLDETNKEGIPFANLGVLNSIDSSLTDLFHSDEFGNFSLVLTDSVQLFYLKIEAFAYQRKTLPIQNTDSIIIQLQRDTLHGELSEVMITASKKAISIKGDKIIYDIEQMGIGTANNGLEMLQQLPGFSLDKDENVKFRGSTGIQIMINGKKSMLQGDALREFIRSLKGDDIKSVELISQPSARYEATGTTGILNIVLKRNISQSLGGSIYTFGSYGNYFKSKTGGRFFFNDKKWSINSNGSYYNGKSFNDRSVDQSILLGNDQRIINQQNYWLPKTESESFNLGVERTITKNQLISTEWQFYHENEKAQTKGKTLDYLNDGLQQKVDLTQQNRTSVDNFSGNLFYNYTSDSSTTQVGVQLNYGYYKKSTNGFQLNEYSDGTRDRLNGSNQTNYNLMNAQIDWMQTFLKKFNLETGAKFSYVDMNYFNRYEAAQGSNFMIPDSLMTTDFLYREKLSSAYSQLNYSLEKWSFLAGLRIENYIYDATSHINNQTNTNHYTNWFPSASIHYQKGNHQYRLSYSKRISRPDYLALNPYFQHLDAYTIEKGNPNLKPQFYHSFELNYIYKNSFSFSLYGYLYKGGFVSVIHYQNDANYNLLYQSNASNGSRSGFSMSIPYKVGKWWTMQYSLDAYLQAEKSEIPNYAYNGTGYGYELNIYQRFNLPKSWMLIANGFLIGRSQTPTGYSPVIYDFSISGRKTFFKEKLQLAFGCTNILKKSMWNNYSTVNQVTTHWINKWETRKFFLQLTYQFGGAKEKKVKNTSLDDEQERM
jgi:outer membrane receptor protein involved in Fe transport